MEPTEQNSDVTESLTEITPFTSASESTKDTFIYDDIFISTHAADIYKYGCPPIIILGTIGNLLSIVVLNQRCIRASITGFFMTVLAVCDTIILYAGLVPIWMQHVFDLYPGELVMSLCPTYWSFLYFVIQYQAWILVSVSTERFVAVWFPTYHKRIFNRTNATIQLAVTFVVLLAFNLHFHFTYSYEDCSVTTDEYQYYEHYVYPWIDFALYGGLPFSLMIMLSGAIIGKLYHNKKNVSGFKISSMTIIMLTVSLVFMFITFPLCIYLILVPRLMEGADTKIDQLNAYVVAYAWVTLLFYSNNAINCGLYILSGRRFRRSLKIMFCRKNKVGQAKPCDPPQPEPT